MNQRRIAAALILLLCVTALLSGALLILHTGHECHQATCPICMILARNTEFFLSLLIAFAGIGMLAARNKHCLCPSTENRVVPDWTLVHRKVKLQD